MEWDRLVGMGGAFCFFFGKLEGRMKRGGFMVRR